MIFTGCQIHFKICTEWNYFVLIFLSLVLSPFLKIYIKEGGSQYEEKLQIPASITRGSLMFWGVISRSGPVCLVCVTGDIPKLEIFGKVKTSDSIRYRSLLTEYLLPFSDGNNLRGRTVFQQYNASIYVSSVLQEFFQQEGLIIPLRPAKSPDLSVIENIWGMIKNMLAKIVVKNVEKLKYQVEQCWEKLYTEGTCRKLYDNIPKLTWINFLLDAMFCFWCFGVFYLWFWFF